MTHQLDLADLKLQLGIKLFLDLDEHALINTKRHGLVCDFMGLRLSSVFQPLLRADGKVLAQQALLRPSLLEFGELAPEDAFDQAVQTDRLVRAIHLLNHARSFVADELLFLKVHPRLLSSVSNHGRVFEQILHYYSVPTSSVVIEIREAAVESDFHLAAAVQNYRSLGYRIGLSGFGTATSNLERVLDLQPDIVKLDGSLIQAAEHSHSAAASLKQLVARFHSADIQVTVEGIETARQLEIARNSGADLLQGYYLAQPEFAVATRKQPGSAELLAA